MRNRNPTLIPHELASAVKGGFVTSAELIKDYILNKSLEEINSNIIEQLNSLSDFINSLMNNVANSSDDIYEGNSALTTANSIAELLKLLVLKEELDSFKEEILPYLDSLSDYATINYVDGLLNNIANLIQLKQNLLVNEINIKSINGNSLLGSGQIFIEEAIYNSNFDESMTTTESIGNISSGTRLSLLKNKTMSLILDMALFREIWNDPNLLHTISYSNVVKLIKEGSSITLPNITTTWNNLVTPTNLTISTRQELINPEGNNVILSSIYNISGNWTWKLYYSYPASTYTITSNFGNTQEVTIPAVTNLMKSEVIKVTRPVYINNEELELFPIQTLKIININLNGSPEIKVPWSTSQVKVEVDLGFGYMDVNGWTRTIVDNNIILKKQDSYLQSVPHRITITLIKN